MRRLLVMWAILMIAWGQQQINFPGIAIPQETLTQVRRAHKYSQHQLDLYNLRRTSKYTLYLALQNYAQILNDLRSFILEGASNYIAGSNNLVMGKGNVVIGSGNKLAGSDNWILTSKEVKSQSIENDVLYIGSWRVRLDLIPQIEYRPEVAIKNMEQQDHDIIRNMRNMQDFRKFWNRNYLRWH